MMSDIWANPDFGIYTVEVDREWRAHLASVYKSTNLEEASGATDAVCCVPSILLVADVEMDRVPGVWWRTP
jgi:hypothetical protein